MTANENAEIAKRRTPATRICSICDREFSRADATRRHMITAHGTDRAERDPRKRHAFAAYLKRFADRTRDRIDQIGKPSIHARGSLSLQNPVEVTAPAKGRVAVRSIRPGAPSKDDEDEEGADYEDEEEGEEEEEGVAEAPEEAPKAPQRREKQHPSLPDVPDYPSYVTGQIVRICGDDYKVDRKGVLSWEIFPKYHGQPNLKVGDRLRVNGELREIHRHLFGINDDPVKEGEEREDDKKGKYQFRPKFFDTKEEEARAQEERNPPRIGMFPIARKPERKFVGNSLYGRYVDDNEYDRDKDNVPDGEEA